MPPYDIGQLAQNVLDALNKLSALRAAGASEYSIRLAESALKAAQVAEQAATGSQFGMGAGSGMGVTGLARLASEAGFATPGLFGAAAGSAGLIGAGGLLLGGSTPSREQAQQMQANPSPTWAELGGRVLQGARSGLNTLFNIGNPPPPQPTNYPSTFSVPTTGQPAWGTTGSPSRSPDALMEQNARRMTALRKVFRPRGTRQRLN